MSVSFERRLVKADAEFPSASRRRRVVGAIPALECDPVRVDEFRFREPAVAASFQPFGRRVSFDIRFDDRFEADYLSSSLSSLRVER